MGSTLAAPATLTASYDGAAINLSWTGVAGATAYNVYRSNASGAETLYKTAVPASGLLRFADSAVVAGQTYDYQVTAVAGPVEGPRSNEASATIPPITPPVPPPTAPVRVYASLLDTGGGTFVPFLTWGYADPTGVARFRVYRSSGVGGEVEITAPSGIAAHDLVDRTAQAGIPYAYRVTATSSGTEGPRSASASVTVPFLTLAPVIGIKRNAPRHHVSGASAVPRGPLHAAARPKPPVHHPRHAP